MYAAGVSPKALWDDAPRSASTGSCQVWGDGAGIVPPGSVFHVTRIDWRARLHEGDGSSYFELQVGPWRGTSTLRRVGKETSADSGMWTGDILVPSEDESSIVLTCAYHALGEAVVYGRLERP